MITQAKDAPTFYTPERVAAARHNYANYDWAKQAFARLQRGDPTTYYISSQFGPAEAILKTSDDFTWMLMPTTRIARFVPEISKARCPVHGDELRRLDPYCGFNIDPINHPYKVQCKAGGEWWPSNDYLAGDMTSGEYPDDGNGIERDGIHYMFLRTYAHMSYAAFVVPSLRSLSQSWLITGDKEYARKGVILLAKVAMEYPNHSDRADRLFYAMYPDRSDPDYDWKNGGMITDLIWETFCLEQLVYAYDGLYNYMDQDPELIAFLKEKGMPIETGDDLRRYIEQHILRSGLEALQLMHVQGNPGHHQATAAAIGLVLDDYNDSPDNPFNSVAAVEFVYRTPAGRIEDKAYSGDILINSLYRDGGGEESPGYAAIKLDYIRVARLIEEIRAKHPNRFPRETYPELFGGPKSAKLFDFFLDIFIHGAFIPAIGDGGSRVEAPRRLEPSAWTFFEAERFLYAFQNYGHPRFARAVMNLRTGAPAAGELFEPYPLDAIEKAAADYDGQADWKTRLLDGYGVAILDSGEGAHRRALVLNYSTFLGHQQADRLMIQLFARGVDLLLDLGYPNGWTYADRWDSNAMAHNTVTIDETQPTMRTNAGRLRLFASKDGVHVASASHNPYSRNRASIAGDNSTPNDLYQRTAVLVDVDETRFYVVDLFAVNGGTQHDQSWHGMLVPMQDPDLKWTGRPGTLAGENVPLFGSWTDRWGRARDDFPSFVENIRTATLSEPATWTWNSGLPEGDTLRLHVIPTDRPLELIRGAGRSPTRPVDWQMDYLLLRDHTPKGETTRYLSVLDTSQGEPVVKRVRLVSRNPLVVAVELADGEDLIHLNLPTRDSTSTATQAVGLRVESKRNDATWRDVRIGQWSPEVRQRDAFFSGKVTATDYENNRIAVEADGVNWTPGMPIRIYNNLRTAVYHVTAVAQEGDQTWLTLDATALVARGRLLEADGGKLTLDTYLTFADGTDAVNFHAGAWLSAGNTMYAVKGVDRVNVQAAVTLRDAMAAERHLQQQVGQMLHIWQYHVGDMIEVTKVESANSN